MSLIKFDPEWKLLPVAIIRRFTPLPLPLTPCLIFSLLCILNLLSSDYWLKKSVRRRNWTYRVFCFRSVNQACMKQCVLLVKRSKGMWYRMFRLRSVQGNVVQDVPIAKRVKQIWNRVLHLFSVSWYRVFHLRSVSNRYDTECSACEACQGNMIQNVSLAKWVKQIWYSCSACEVCKGGMIKIAQPAKRVKEKYRMFRLQSVPSRYDTGCSTCETCLSDILQCVILVKRVKELWYRVFCLRSVSRS
jgi:hypothetical protein